MLTAQGMMVLGDTTSHMEKEVASKTRQARSFMISGTKEKEWLA